MNVRQQVNLLIQQATQDLKKMEALCQDADELLLLNLVSYRLIQAGRTIESTTPQG